jgi:hypothetical protein
MNNQLGRSWYQNPLGIIILLILFFPIGLYLMWKYEIWSPNIRWVISGVFALLLTINVKNDSIFTELKSSFSNVMDNEYKGVYKFDNGTDVKGTITISNNGSFIYVLEGYLGQSLSNEDGYLNGDQLVFNREPDNDVIFKGTINDNYIEVNLWTSLYGNTKMLFFKTDEFDTLE